MLGRDAAAQGAAGLHGLELFAVGNAAADVKDDLADGDAHGHLDQPGVVHLAGQRKDRRARASRRSDAGEPVRAVDEDLRNVRVRLDVVEVGRFVPQAPDCGEGGTGAGLAAPTLDGSNQRGLFTADKRAGAFLDSQMEGKARAQDVVAEQAVLFRLGDSELEPVNSQRVLGAAVDVALVGANGVPTDGHPFQEGVRVPLDDRAVHKSARVPFIGVADDVFLVASGAGRELPLEAGKESRAAPASQARVAYGVDDVLGGHLGQCLCQPVIATSRDVFLDVLGVDDAAVAQGDPHLLAVEGDIIVKGHCRFAIRAAENWRIGAV